MRWSDVYPGWGYKVRYSGDGGVVEHWVLVARNERDRSETSGDAVLMLDFLVTQHPGHIVNFRKREEISSFVVFPDKDSFHRRITHGWIEYLQ